MRLSLALAFLFFIGSCFGWVLELLYRNLTHRHKKWINPGFCTGPYLPIYGFGLCTLFLLASHGGSAPDRRPRLEPGGAVSLPWLSP